MLTKLEFDILYSAFQNKKIKGGVLSGILNDISVPLETTKKKEEELFQLGFLDEDMHITSQGKEALAPYKVDNAVILAAGFSSRCAPLSYEKPKGLFKVKGEILIERQIRQLRERGIQEIFVVVGYMKELFFYLEDKFDVHIITNQEYMTRNNLSSLNAVKQYLGNSFICYSDNYIINNGYEEYVYDSYFAAMYSKEYTDEYIMKTDEEGIITQYYQGGADAWYQMGEMYFDRKTASRFIKLMEREYNYPSVFDMKLDDFFIRHLSEFKIYSRHYPENSVREFDTIAEIEEFDSEFFQNMGGNILSNIHECFDCKDEEISDIRQLTAGLTNVTFSFLCRGKKYIYRHPGLETDKFIDRAREGRAQAVAGEMGLDPTLVEYDSDRGWKISEFFENIAFDYDNRADEKKAIDLIRRIHAKPRRLGWELNMMEKATQFQRLVVAEYYDVFREFEDLRNRMEQLYVCAKSDGYELEMCHNDVSDSNILLGKNATILIDWEYAADNDPAADIASYIVTGKHTEKDCDRILRQYFGRPLVQKERRHYYAYVAITGYFWFSWAVYMESIGQNVGELMHLLYHYALHYSPIALDMYQGGTENNG